MITEENAKPYIHVNGSLPWYCTDASKLRVICPLKYRQYADRIEENVPIFRETVRLGDHVAGDGGHRVKGIPGVSLAVEDAPGAEDVDALASFGAKGVGPGAHWCLDCLGDHLTCESTHRT